MSMIEHVPADISRFFVVGINYKKTDASVRGLFAINDAQYENILALAPAAGIRELLVLSTCNRTELYGFAESAGHLIDLLCRQTTGTRELFIQLAYIKNGDDAISHLFHVGAGLDSQILGDYEIVGQIKQALKFTKDRFRAGSFLERLVNAVLQSSKVIKNKTALSGGTVSVSFAAVQYIREKIRGASSKNILLLGTGKIGRNTCKNLVDYLPSSSITLINRTEGKAAELAAELSLEYAPIEDLSSQIKKADIILVATNSSDPVILKSQLENSGEKLIIDLSIPYNVENGARFLPNVTLINVDELSKLKDETLKKRAAEIPKARYIIEEHLVEFMEWQEMRRYSPVLKAVKYKLREMQSCSMFSSRAGHNKSTTSTEAGDEARIQKVINVMAQKMRRQNQSGCQYIEAINDYIA